MSATVKWRRLRSLSWPQRFLVLWLLCAYPLCALALQRWGLARVQRRLLTWSNSPPGGATTCSPPEILESVELAARHAVGNPNCLQRSLLLWALLRRQGMRPELRIGTRRSSRHGILDFHAWVEHDGQVLNDSPNVRKEFATFDRPILPPEASFT